MARNEVKWGAILSYVLIIFNAVYGLIIAPFILSSIGNSEYGVYKTIGSMTASLAVLDLGLGATVQRYIAKYKAKNEEQTASNFSAMAFLQAGVLAFVTALVSIGLYFSLNSVYGKSFTEFELFRAKQIFIVQAIYMVCHIFENIFAGIIAGNNKFVFSNTVKIISLIIKISLYCIFLPIFKNSLVIAVVALLLEFMIIGIEFISATCRL